MKWITREHAKVDRIACPWLIKNFVDNDARFLFAPAHKVIQIAKQEEVCKIIASRSIPSIP